MKKISIITGTIFLALIIAGPAFCAAVDIEGEDQEIADATGGGSGLDNIDLSPNVSVRYSGAQDQYEMSSVNANGKIEYGIFSGDNVVYMHEAALNDADEAILSTFTTTDGTTVTSWTPMGGVSGS